MKMKLIAMLMILVFMMSIVPATYADESVDAVAVADKADDDDMHEKVEDEVEVEVEDEVEDEVEVEVEDEVEKEARERVRTLKRVRTADGELREGGRMEKRAELTAEKIAHLKEVREKYKMKLERALELCKEKAAEPSECEEKLKVRVEHIGKITEEQIEHIKEHEEKRIEKKKKQIEFKKSIKAGRKIAKKKREEARKEYKRAKEEFEEHKKEFKNKKEQVEKLKSDLKECKGDDTEECNEKRKEIRRHSIDFLKRTANVILSHIEKLRHRVEEAEHLDEAQAADIMERLDAAEAEVNAILEELEALGDGATKQEIKALAKKMRDLWKKHRKYLKLGAARHLQAKLGNILVKTKKLEGRLDHIITKMIEEGEDTSHIEALVDKFHELLATAEEEYKAAREAIADHEPDEGQVKEGENHIKAANGALKDAHLVLRDIFQALREAKVDVTSDSSEDVIDEAEDSDEDASQES